MISNFTDFEPVRPGQYFISEKGFKEPDSIAFVTELIPAINHDRTYRPLVSELLLLHCIK